MSKISEQDRSSVSGERRTADGRVDPCQKGINALGAGLK